MKRYLILKDKPRKFFPGGATADISAQFVTNDNIINQNMEEAAAADNMFNFNYGFNSSNSNNSPFAFNYQQQNADAGVSNWTQTADSIYNAAKSFASSSPINTAPMEKLVPKTDIKLDANVMDSVDSKTLAGTGQTPAPTKSGMSASTGGVIAGAVGTAASLVTEGVTEHFSNKLQQNSTTDGFNLERLDPKYYEKLQKAQDIGKSMSTGIALGTSIGSAINPGMGTAIGAVGGALAGLGYGLFNKKAAREAARMVKDYNEQYEKAYKGTIQNQDILAARALMARKGLKLSKPGAVNVITKGKLHKENNNLGNKDKGIPVVDASGRKEYELEKEELVLRKEATLKAEELVKKFDETNDEAVLEELGKYIAEELLHNTHDHSDKYKVKVKDEA